MVVLKLQPLFHWRRLGHVNVRLSHSPNVGTAPPYWIGLGALGLFVFQKKLTIGKWECLPKGGD